MNGESSSWQNVWTLVSICNKEYFAFFSFSHLRTSNRTNNDFLINNLCSSQRRDSLKARSTIFSNVRNCIYVLYIIVIYKMNFINFVFVEKLQFIFSSDSLPKVALTVKLHAIRRPLFRSWRTSMCTKIKTRNSSCYSTTLHVASNQLVYRV